MYILKKELNVFCDYFGRKVSIETILPHLPSFLSPHSYWELKVATFSKIVSVMILAGHKSLEYMLDIIVRTIYDDNELVVEKALNSLSSFCREGLIYKKEIALEIFKACVPLLVHPNLWIRNGVISLVSNICENKKETFSKVDVNCFFLPKLENYLIYPITKVNQKNLLESVKKPIDREIINVVTSIALDVINLSSEKIDPITAFIKFLEQKKISSENKEQFDTLVSMFDYFKCLAEREKSEQTDVEDIKKLATSVSRGVSFVKKKFIKKDPQKYFSDEEINKKYPKFGNSKENFNPNNFSSQHVTTLYEHKDSVNQICVSDDCQFFASASNDGTVKIWDSNRFKNKVTHKSRATFKAKEGRVTCVSTLQSSHTVICGTDKGMIHIFNVRSEKTKNNKMKYSNFVIPESIDKSSEGSIIQVGQYSKNSKKKIERNISKKKK